MTYPPRNCPARNSVIEHASAVQRDREFDSFQNVALDLGYLLNLVLIAYL